VPIGDILYCLVIYPAVDLANGCWGADATTCEAIVKFSIKRSIPRYATSSYLPRL
jgi:hypothetical protein